MKKYLLSLVAVAIAIVSVSYSVNAKMARAEFSYYFSGDEEADYLTSGAGGWVALASQPDCTGGDRPCKITVTDIPTAADLVNALSQETGTIENRLSQIGASIDNDLKVVE